MSGTDGLAEFLAARYDEAEAKANAAAEYDGKLWHAGEPREDPGGWSYCGIFDEDGANVVADFAFPGAAAYIADVDPAHRLADIALKRAILADVARICEVSNDLGSFRLAVRTMRQLGNEFSKHPEYKAGWAL